MLIPTNTPASSSIPVGATIYVDATNGNDSTGLRGRLDKPFATPSGAAGVAQAGDTIVLGPGTFNIGTTQIVLPVGVNLTGAGTGVLIPPGINRQTFTPSGGTIIQTTMAGTTATINTQGNNVLCGFTLYDTVTSGGTAIPIGKGGADTFTGGTIVLDHVQILCGTDGVYFSGNGLGTNYIILRNVTISTDWDAIALFGASGTTYNMDMWECDINAVYAGSGNSNTQHCINQSITASGSGANINAFGCRFTSVGGPSNSACEALHLNRGTMNVFGGYLSVSGATGGVVHSINQVSTGNCYVSPGTIWDSSTVTGNVSGNQGQTIGTGTPTSASATANGSTGTTTLSSGSTDQSGQITITPGGSGITTGTIASVTFAVARRNCFPLISPANAAAAAIFNSSAILPASPSSTGFSVACGAALTSGTAYQFNYLCVGP